MFYEAGVRVKNGTHRPRWAVPRATTDDRLLEARDAPSHVLFCNLLQTIVKNRERGARHGPPSSWLKETWRDRDFIPNAVTRT